MRRGLLDRWFGKKQEEKELKSPSPVGQEVREVVLERTGLRPLALRGSLRLEKVLWSGGSHRFQLYTSLSGNLVLYHIYAYLHDPVPRAEAHIFENPEGLVSWAEGNFPELVPALARELGVVERV